MVAAMPSPSTGAARPRAANAGVAFLVCHRTVPDAFMDQAERWVRNIQGAVGSGVIVDVMGSGTITAAAIRAADQQIANARLGDQQLDEHLGGLRGRTLVLVTHGLRPDPTVPPDLRLASQGLMLEKNSTTDRDLDVVLDKQSLDFMTYDAAQDEVVLDTSKIQDIPENRAIIDKVRGFAPVIDALRHSSFEQIYLAACGDNDRLVEFSRALFELVDHKTIYFNDEAIFVTLNVPNPIAEVGVEDPVTHRLTRAQGKRFYSQTRVSLASQPDGFLPGSTRRVP
jgi:hypothetical protein